MTSCSCTATARNSKRGCRQIRSFLRETLRLELKDDVKLRPLRAGIDFLGYVVFPTHTRVRRRVVRHAFAAARCAEPSKYPAVLASYLGHFSHANAFALSSQLRQCAKV
jgi:RNA-directed DNA polymerase